MQTVTRIAELRELVTSWRLGRESIAFVPTMGNLHMGHASLMAAAHLHGRRVVSSVFVNPTAVRPERGFLGLSAHARRRRRPARRIRRRCALPARRVDEMYPQGSNGSTVVDVPGLTDILCGVVRPGHFQGVATVVVKLFCLVQPDVAIFGEKDYQQLTVIRRVVQDLNLPVTDRRCADGARGGRPRAEFPQSLPDCPRSARRRRGSTARSTGATPDRIGRCRPRRRSKRKASRRCVPPGFGPIISKCARRIVSRGPKGRTSTSSCSRPVASARRG